MFDERYYPIETKQGIMELPSVTTILRVHSEIVAKYLDICYN